MDQLPRTDLGNVAALLELCDAQQNTIDRLQSALSEHEEAMSDRHLLKRMLAHELRTPLAAIIGTLHTLAIPNLDADMHADLRERSLRQAKQLNEMIDDILHLADPHEASVDRAPQEVLPVSKILDDVRIQVAGALDSERLVFDSGDEVAVRTIPGRVRQILVNLVVNAAKYSPDDSPVVVSATRLDDRIIFEVVDHGSGIEPEKVEALFEAFRQGEAATEGVGLGLFLTRNLVRSLGGAIELIPRDGGGTLARVELPQKRLEDAAARPQRHLRAIS